MNIFKKKSLEQMLQGAQKTDLKKNLKAKDIAAFGIGAVVGVGIFVATGEGAHAAGPAVIVSFIIAGIIACLCALCYCELSTMFPVAGSTYSYSYIVFGEIIAMIIGWCLTAEYLVACSAVASGWSGTFVGILNSFGITLPSAFITSPAKGGIVDLPAILIIAVITYILYYGMKESAKVNNIIVGIKISIIVIFVILGVTHISPANYKPFAPFGFNGIFAATAAIFFSFIGFDAISTAAEEAENPKRDIPLGIIICLIAVTVLYVAVAVVLTGMVPFQEIISENAVPGALARVGINWGAALVGTGAVLGMISTIMVVLYGQVRIFMVMSRDGLLPKIFSKVHPKHKTPYFSTLITGTIAAIIAGFLPLDIIVQFLSIGTLLSFISVSVAVIVLRKTMPNFKRIFRAPGVPVTPALSIICCVILLSRLHAKTWMGFLVWLAIGLLMYAFYGRKHSTLQKGESPDKPEDEVV
ncbi:amino acid permease [Clostridium saccharobutylicum]|uniref:Amino acid permease YhdG n=1 Tax=Clostridium saccharobutylicum DSM 13864 TaxID=1345695 RepID=U5MTI5_CLOSA|nr:amino acid permease [Clostridium saccharobutylicum]AGX42767.1 amino acid permease YhdG [Clostridium saccharobutylicum DSM 13864]AQR90063.1 putative amino acid permease YhdG [Clostridium saccharobutylicum]AQR99968.1 putative amino acid permease YhdG [Clostridium saccharobutylicum]AQS13952.1 putative amino acid permease YhdG [Clostridium saccharobutylicum]MBA2904639.1 APA family basic amino acid/polyamine antiporter [Clostridium saccharobutylicum]